MVPFSGLPIPISNSLEADMTALDGLFLIIGVQLIGLAYFVGIVLYPPDDY